MRIVSRAAFVFLLCGLAAYAMSSLQQTSTAGDDKDGPKIRLAVIIVFDQMRGDYLEKWKDLFEEGGFKRLQAEGAWFTNCHYPYADTWTSAGHASLVTGTSPYKHGIVANSWYDRVVGDYVESTESTRYEQVP